MELCQVPIAQGQSRKPFDHGVANHFELAIGQGIAGQRFHREQGAEHLAVRVGVAISEQPKFVPHRVRGLPECSRRVASVIMLVHPLRTLGDYWRRFGCGLSA